MSVEKLRCEAQVALDDLWTAKLIPFELEARKIDSLGNNEFIVRFYDSRLRSVDVSWENGDSFGDVVRVAVLDRVKRIDVPSHDWPIKVRRSHAAS